MTITFNVETGAALSTSTSYASVDQFLQYHYDLGTDHSALDPDKIKAYLNKATAYIEYNYTFDGIRVTSDQALKWPRVDLTDRTDGVVVAFGCIPAELIKSVCYLAGILATGAEIIRPDDGVSSQSVAGISTSYIHGGQRRYPYVDKLLSPYLAPSMRAERVR